MRRNSAFIILAFATMAVATSSSASGQDSGSRPFTPEYQDLLRQIDEIWDGEIVFDTDCTYQNCNLANNLTCFCRVVYYQNVYGKDRDLRPNCSQSPPCEGSGGAICVGKCSFGLYVYSLEAPGTSLGVQCVKMTKNQDVKDCSEIQSSAPMFGCSLAYISDPPTCLCNLNIPLGTVDCNMTDRDRDLCAIR
jgi:hypothetical protein